MLWDDEPRELYIVFTPWQIKQVLKEAKRISRKSGSEWTLDEHQIVAYARMVNEEKL